MASVPSATTSVSDTAGTPSAGTDLICVLAPVPLNADIVPRLYGNAAAVYSYHGYSIGVEYAALHAKLTGKSFLFVGLPIGTPGAVGRTDASGNTGTSVVSAAAGGSGVLMAHEGSATIVRGGLVGTDQIAFDLSCDKTRSTKRVRLGTANSYTIPHLGVTLSFGAGTLVAGDVALTWVGTDPRAASGDLTTARTRLASQLKQFRSIMLAAGDFQDSTEATAFLTELEAYKNSNQRFIYGRASLRDRLPQAALGQVVARMTGNPNLTFAEVGGSGDTITRSAGSWITDGFAVNDWVTITDSASNNVSGPIASLSATVLTLGTTDLTPEGPVGNVTVVGSPTITFAEVGGAGDTIMRSRGSWLDDGFRVGDKIVVAGSASNNITAAQGLAAVTATVLTLGTDDLAAEAIASSALTITAGQTKAAWVADLEATFAGVNSHDGRLDLSMGKGRYPSAFTGWNFRYPSGWAASLREYQHDLHVATWRKSDGPTGFDLFDEDGLLVEWDDRPDVDGGAASAARFTSFRTWPNGPQGAFVTQSLTRADEGSLLSQTHNIAVVNLACTVNQLATENVVGRSLQLNDDGTATTESLNQIRDEVNAALANELLINKKGEGPRASKALWTPSTDDVLNIPEANLTGVLVLNLNGTIHSVNTSVALSSGGQQ